MGMLLAFAPFIVFAVLERFVGPLWGLAAATAAMLDSSASSQDCRSITAASATSTCAASAASVAADAVRTSIPSMRNSRASESRLSCLVDTTTIERG